VSTQTEAVQRRVLLSQVFDTYRRFCSKPPKESKQNNAQKNAGKSDSGGGGGGGGGGAGGGKKGGKKDENNWFNRFQKGDIPWDDKDFRTYLMVSAAFWAAVAYFFFRDTGKEVTWKDFVNGYLAKGVVDRLEVVNKRFVKVIFSSGKAETDG
ncbi:AFG3-like protein 2, partial [Silurus asotus]